MSGKINELIELLGNFDVVDLSHTIENNMPTFPSHTKYFINNWICPGDPAFLNSMVMGDHTGTHMDAPAHFLHDESDPNRKLIHEIDPMAISGRAIKMTFGPFPAENCTISAQDIKDWEAKNIEIAEGDIVFIDYQWADKWTTVDISNAVMEAWPGLDVSAADYLLEKKIRVIGSDCASIDAADGDGFQFPAHLKILTSGILMVENLKNLGKVPSEFFFVGMPLKLKDAGGSPIRAVALVPRN